MTILRLPHLPNDFGQRRLGGFAFLLHAHEGGRLIELEPNPHRDAQQENGHKEGNAPAPVVEGVFTQ
jgi:hypothetical protein